MTRIREAFFEFARRRFGYGFPSLGRAAFDLAFKIAPENVRTELLPGIFATLDLSDEVQRATYWQGERFEKPTLPVLNQWIDEGATLFFDIGSNYGFFCFALLARHPGLKAHAFEPNPVTFSHLSEIKAENHLDRLDTWNLGLGDRNATLPLRLGVSDSGHSTFGDHPQLRADMNEVVEVLDFETWRRRACVELPEPGKWVAKIDVEGFEMKVLEGLRPALEARAFRGLAVEINNFTLGFCGSQPEDIYSYMEDLGYHGLTRVDGPLRRRFTGNEFFVPR